MKVSFVAIGLAVMVAGCAHPKSGPSGVNAQLQDPAGRAVGQARLEQRSGGVSLSMRVEGVSPGTHGVHVHAVGRCEVPAFTSAGPHWNPTGRQHGKDNPTGMHKGDLPNLTVGSDGRGSLSFMLDGAVLADMLDADGAALVVHAAADDYRTDPSGNSGARIACGVIGS